MVGEESRTCRPARSLRLSAEADTRHLASLRRRVRRFLHEHRSPPDVVDDLELVVSELTTNVIQHTDSATLTVRIAADDDCWLLDVGDADGLLGVDDVTPPSPEAVDGRGLLIVNELMDEVSVVSEEGRRFVRCVRSTTRHE